MGRVVEHIEFLNTQEVMDELGASKKLFYGSVRRRLRAYQFDAKKKAWYKKSDVIALKNGKVPRMASISISGIQRDWTDFLRSLGFEAATIDCSIEETVLPIDAVITFRLPVDDKRFVKRTRMTLADGIPICTWATYYPLELVEGDTLTAMKNGTASDVVKRIQEQHGIIIGLSKDKYSARLATFAEQELLQLPTDEAVLILQRVSHTADRKVFVLYSDMVLLGNWFAPEHEYKVMIWE